MEQGKIKADASVTHAAQAGDSLHSITSSASRINEMNMEIASASEEQSAVAEEITKNVISIQDASTQTALSAQQTATASSELLNLASRLQMLVDNSAFNFYLAVPKPGDHTNTKQKPLHSPNFIFLFNLSTGFHPQHSFELTRKPLEEKFIQKKGAIWPLFNL